MSQSTLDAWEAETTSKIPERAAPKRKANAAVSRPTRASRVGKGKR